MFERIGVDDTQKWDNIVNRYDTSTVFHTNQWAKLFSSVYGHELHLYYLNYNDDSETLWVMPLSHVCRPFGKGLLVSLPYSDFAGPLSSSNVVREYCISLASMLDRSYYIRSEYNYSDDCVSNYSTYRIQLPTTREDMMSMLPYKSVKYPISKSHKDGYRIRAAAEKDVEDLYRLMSITRRRHGLPTQPKQFFVEMKHELIHSGCASLYVAVDESDKAVAASVFMWHKRFGYYKYSASLRLPGVGNVVHALLWEGVKEAIDRNCLYFDLGRVASNNRGLAMIKKHWGGVEIPLYYQLVTTEGVFSNVSKDDSISRLMRSMLSRAPVQASQVLGKLLYRYYS